MTEQEDPPHGMMQAVGQAAVTLAQGLKGQPIVVGFLIINLAMLVVVFILTREQRVREHELTRSIIDRCWPHP